MTRRLRAEYRSEPTLIRKRHVFYVEGYDPQGAEGYYQIFRRECHKFQQNWQIKVDLGELQIDSNDIAYWNIESTGPNWHVTTRYELLRLEALLTDNLAQPILRQVARALRWMLDDLLTGTFFRIFRASWRFAGHLLYAQVLLIAWLAFSIGGGWLVAFAATHILGWPVVIAVVIGAAVTVAVFASLRPLADRWFVTRINNCWPYLRDFARGRASGYDRSLDVFAKRIIAAAREGQADEILIIGHSAGCVTSPVLLTHALELDPNLGRHRPRIVLLTIGSLLPACALHPAATALRAAIRRVAIEPSVQWIDCQALADIMNFWNFDPVEDVGVHIEQGRCNPTIWKIHMREMLSPDTYNMRRWNFFRMHFQFIMANDRRSFYEYFMLVCGPVWTSDWAARGRDIVPDFAADGAYTETQAVAAAP